MKRQIISLLLAFALVCGALSISSSGASSGASSELFAAADSTIVIDGRQITRVAGIPTAAELRAQLESDGEITVGDLAHGELVANNTPVSCGEQVYFAVITGDVCADARLNARDVIAMMKQIASGETDAAADVDLDGAANARDVILLMRRLVGWDETIGAEYFEYSEAPVAAPCEDESLSLFFGDNLTKKDKGDASVDGGATDTIRLAKNEIEFTQFFLTSETNRSDLVVTATDFVSLKGDVMESELLCEHYLEMTECEAVYDAWYIDQTYEYPDTVRWADALPPAASYPFKLVAGESQGFVIKAKSSADAPAGLYRAKISVKSGDRVVKRADVFARVWDFALSDETACATAFGLSSYNIYLYHRQYDPDDKVLYRAYYDFLLENRVSAYYLPYSVLDERADEYMSNPRVTSFMIDGRNHPNAGTTPDSQGSMTDTELEAAYEKLSKNPDWMKKGYFYYVDEPSNEYMAAEVAASASRLKEHFPEYRLTVPYFTNYLDGDDMTAFLRESGVNLWSPLSDFWTAPGDERPMASYIFDDNALSRYGTAEERFANYVAEGDELWWYVCIIPQYPYANFFAPYQGALTRVLFWQQYMYNVDGVLYWAVNDWQNGAEWRTMDCGFAYGDGRLLYCGAKYGVRGPISSLRLEIIRDGIEDFQYLKMAEDALGKAEVDRLVARVTTGILDYTHDADVIREVRNALGDALSDALTGK